MTFVTLLQLSQQIAGALEIRIALGKAEAQQVLAASSGKECCSGDGSDLRLAQQRARLLLGIRTRKPRGIGKHVVGAGWNRRWKSRVSQRRAQLVALGLVLAGEAVVEGAGQLHQSCGSSVLKRRRAAHVGKVVEIYNG